jgi:hypothetical protein
LTGQGGKFIQSISDDGGRREEEGREEREREREREVLLTIKK